MADEREKMRAMNAWLDDVCCELGVDRTVMTEATGPLLALIRHVAHGPSRPAAPLTAFAVGLASGLAAGSADGSSSGAASRQVPAVEERVAIVEGLVETWRASQPAADSPTPGELGSE